MPDIFVSKNTKSTVSPAKGDSPSGKKLNKVKLFTSYCMRPEIFLSNLNDKEEVLLFLRRHFVTNVPWIIQGIILIILPAALGLLIATLGIAGFQIPSNLYLFALLFYYLLVFEFFLLNFINWFYNISLVTNQRVIDVDFRILHSKHIAATKIVQIEDVSLNEVGLIRSVFDYGDVRIQTAGASELFEFLAVPHPEDVVHIIGDLIGGQHA